MTEKKTKYIPKLDFLDTQRGIKLVKDSFERALARKLGLIRVTAPRFLVTGTGLQDDLAGTQEPVSFKTQFADSPVEVVHSLAKWKRHTLGRHKFPPGKGIYTDMDAIRKDEAVSEIHSIYVDQWDWEKAIRKKDRSLEYLKSTVRKIYSAILETEKKVLSDFPIMGKTHSLAGEISFVHSEDLEKEFSHLSPAEREAKIAKRHGAVFIIGIGHSLPLGKKPHDLRAADYDDWSTETRKGKRGLNGDIIVWDPVRESPLELSSMGIRVDSKAMEYQLALCGLLERKSLPFHKGVLEGSSPLSIGGGIGQSRLCQILLKKAHIGEVQSSVWPIEHQEKWGAILL